MFCKYCGNPIEENGVFCSKCGKRVEEKVSDTGENEGESSVSVEEDSWNALKADSSASKGDTENVLKESSASGQAIWNSLKSGSYGHIPAKTKVLPIVIICILLGACVSYHYAWFPGWGDDLSNCLGEKIGTVRWLHSVKKEELGYSAGDGEYILFTDDNDIVTSIGSPSGTKAKKYHIGGVYAGQSQSEASDMTKHLHTIVSEDMVYIGREGDEGSGRYMQITYVDNQVYAMAYMIDENLEYNLEKSLAEYGYTGDMETEDSVANNNTNIDDSGAYYDPYGDLKAIAGDDTYNYYDDYEDDYEDDDDDDDEFYSSGYILPTSSTKKLKKKDLKGLSKQQLRLARNEIYARHGRLFQDGELQSYFNGQDWYYGTIYPEDFDDAVELNDIERYNAKFILKYEQK